MNGTILSNLGAKKVVPHRQCQTDDAEIVSQNDHPKGKSSITSKILKRQMKSERSVGHWCGAYHKTSDGKVRIARRKRFRTRM